MDRVAPVPFEDARRLAPALGPDQHPTVLTARSQERAVWAVGHAVDGAIVAWQRVKQFSGVHLPDPYRLILAGGGQQAAVRVERHPGYPGCVSLEVKRVDALLAAPDLQFSWLLARRFNPSA